MQLLMHAKPDLLHLFNSSANISVYDVGGMFDTAQEAYLLTLFDCGKFMILGLFNDFTNVWYVL